MRFRTTLNHEIEGSFEIDEPEGLSSSIISLTRHPDFHSLVKEFKSSFGSYGTARDWIKNIEYTHGPDSKIQILEEYSSNNFDFFELYSGEIGIQTVIENLDFDHNLEFTPVQDGFWRKMISRFETPVDVFSAVNLDGEAVTVLTPETVNLTPQIIDRTTKYSGHSGDTNTTLDCRLLATDEHILFFGHQIVDGKLTSEGDRILVLSDPGYVAGNQVGIYIASVGTWVRSLDANTATELTFSLTTILEGDTYANTNWRQLNTITTIDVDSAFFSSTDYVDDQLLLTVSDFDLEAGGGTINDEGPYYTLASVKNTQDEIKDSFEPLFSVETSLSSISNLLEINGEFGDIKININTDFSFRLESFWLYGGGSTDSHKYPDYFGVTTKLFYQINSDTPVQIDSQSEYNYFTFTHSTPSSSVLSARKIVNVSVSDYLINVNASDIVTVYAQHIFHFSVIDYSGVGSFETSTWKNINVFGGIKESSISFLLKSVVEQTQSKGILIHDLYSSVLDRITDSGLFYSELLGSPNTRSRVYDYPGQYWNNIALKGTQLRGYLLSEKIFSISMKDILEGLHPILNSGMSYETIDGQQRIVVRKQSEYFDDSEMTVLLSGVSKIKRVYGKEYYNSVEVGYSKGKTEDISGIDDPQSQTRASIFKNIGQPLKILTTWIAQSLTFEQSRRTTKTKSADYTFDNDTFLLEVTYAGGEYNPRLDEDYTSVTNLLNEETRYNKAHTPSRIFLRWLQFISGGLQKYLGTVWRFTSGDGNYDMTSTRVNDGNIEDYGGNPLAENANILVGTNPSYIPQLFEIEHYLSIEDFLLIDSNRNKSIGVSQTDSDHKAFFIQTLELEILSGLIKLTGYFKEEFVIQNPSGSQIIPRIKIFDSTFDDTFE